MVTKTFLRTALSAVTALSLITATGTMLFSCAGSDDDTTVQATNQGNYDSNVQLKAIVKGTVVDDTGAPVVGAIVTVGNMQTTTNEAGQFELNDVPVSGVVSAGNTEFSCVTVTIKAPAESELAETAIAKVKPIAIYNDSAANAASAATSATINMHNPNSSYVNNLLADVGTVVLPHKAASFSGVLRDSKTGKPISNALIRFSLVEPSNIQASDIVVSTDSEGKFSVAGLLTSSSYRVTVDGYKFLGIDTNGDENTDITASITNWQFQCEKGKCTLSTPKYSPTTNETFVGNLIVQPIVATDTVPPRVIVNPAKLPDVIALVNPDNSGDVIDNTASYDTSEIANGNYVMVWRDGVDGKNQPFTIKFTEPMKEDKVSTSSVIIYDRTANKNIEIAQVSWKDEQTLEITTAETVPEGHEVLIRLKREDFVDLAGNMLPAQPVNAIDTRALVTSEVNGSYIQLSTKTYKAPAVALETPQDLRQITVNADETGEILEVARSFVNKDAFFDILPDGIKVVNQANYNADYDAMAELISTVTKLQGDQHDYCMNSVKFAFTPSDNVAKYEIKVKGDSNTTFISLYGYDAEAAAYKLLYGYDAEGAVYKQDGWSINYDGVNKVLTATAPTALIKKYSDFVALLPGGRPLQVEVTPMNEFGDRGLAANFIPEDDTPIFAAIQDFGSRKVDVMTGSAPNGMTGDLVDLGVEGGGTGLPRFYVSARMYALTVADANKGGNLENTLAHGKTTTKSDGSTVYVYTSDDWAAFSKARTLGLAITEEPQDGVAIKDYLKLYKGNTDESSLVESATYARVNNKPAVVFTVNNVLEMQHLTNISLKGLPDKAGNPAGDGAQVKVVDKMPPVLTNVEVQGNKIVLTYSEPVSLANEPKKGSLELVDFNNLGKVVLKDGQFDAGLSSFDDNIESYYTDEYGRQINNLKVSVSQSEDRKTVTITVTGTDAKGEKVDVAALFGNVWRLVNSNSSVSGYGHVVSSQHVYDLKGNNWIEEKEGINFPSILVNDLTPPKIASGTWNIDTNVTPLKLAISCVDISTLDSPQAINMSSAKADNVWEVGDKATTTEEYKVKITFREPVIWDVNNDGKVEAKDVKWFVDNYGLDYSVVAADPVGTQYWAPTDRTQGIEVADCNTVEGRKVCKSLVFHFGIMNGTVKKGDTLIIKNVVDTSGNKVAQIKIQLNAAEKGITVTPTSVYSK